jgi:hypothetical protein
MLANLTINQWTARKHDARASKEVDAAHGANDAGRYNKLLVDKTALEPITKAAGALRQLHYKLTLAWGDNGDRLLPSSLFIDYTNQIRNAKATFMAAVEQFVKAYPALIQDARKRLGTLYEPGDYPATSQIMTRFGCNVGFAPIAAPEDFRVKVGVEQADEIRAEITKQNEQRVLDATKECWTRAREIVERYAERMADQKGKVFDSMVDNARDLVKLLPALNIAGDPELKRVAEEIEDRLLGYSTAHLRSNPVARQNVAKAANDIMAGFKWG